MKIEVGDLEEQQISPKEQNMKSKECQIDIESELDDPTMGKWFYQNHSVSSFLFLFHLFLSFSFLIIILIRKYREN